METKDLPVNVDRPVIRIRYADLEVIRDDMMRRECPFCESGTLPLQRDEDGCLLASDRCVGCGQAVQYTDIEEVRASEGLTYISGMLPDRDAGDVAIKRDQQIEDHARSIRIVDGELKSDPFPEIIPMPVDRSLWTPVTGREYELLHKVFQRSRRRRRGKLPDAVYEMCNEAGVPTRVALQYIEPGKWERWGIQKRPPDDIVESWSTIMGWLRPLIGDRAAIEVYPRDEQVVNTAPFRWFWIVPTDELPKEFDLNYADSDNEKP